MRQAFLDHQSATPVLPEVFDAMKPYFIELFGNPSSLHQQGLRARDAIAQARTQTAALINAESPEDIIFTSSGTEATNLALKGAAYANRRRGNHVVITEIEHPAVLNSVAFLEKEGFTCTRVKVDSRGLVNPSDVAAAITDKTALVCASCQPDIASSNRFAKLASSPGTGIPLFVDAVASARLLSIDFRK
jgi:cysteine desulfurase